MLKKIKHILLLIILILGPSLAGQVSIYENAQPYAPGYLRGDLVKIQINENLAIEVNNDWTTNAEMDLTLVPDKNYFEFLKSVDQSRTNQKKQKQKSILKEKFKFNIMARAQALDDNLIDLQAVKSIVLDGRTTEVTVRGITHPRYIKNARVDSEDMAELIIRIQVKPPVDKSGNVNSLEEPASDTGAVQPGGASAPGSGTGSSPGLNNEQKKQILLNHIREILGALEQ